MPVMLIPLFTALIPMIPSFAAQIGDVITSLTGDGDEISPESARKIHDLSVALTEHARTKEQEHLVNYPPSKQ